MRRMLNAGCQSGQSSPCSHAGEGVGMAGFPGLTLDLWPALRNELTLLLGRTVVGTAPGSGQETTAAVGVDPCSCTVPRAYKVEKISVQIQPLQDKCEM